MKIFSSDRTIAPDVPDLNSFRRTLLLSNLFCFTAADRVCLFWRVKKDIFRSLWTSRLMVLELMSIDFAICHMHLLGFLLILSRIHLIIDLDRCVVYYFVWVRGLPLLERSNKFPLSLKRVNVFQRVDLAIESIFAIAESDFLARYNATIASLLSDIFESFKI